MCAIAGIVGSEPLNAAHREHVGRLSIIALSTGWQPLYNEDEWVRAVRARYAHALEDGLLVQFSVLKPEVVPLLSRSTQHGPLAQLAFAALVLEYWCAAYLEHFRHLPDGSLASSTGCLGTMSPC